MSTNIIEVFAYLWPHGAERGTAIRVGTEGAELDSSFLGDSEGGFVHTSNLPLNYTMKVKYMAKSVKGSGQVLTEGFILRDNDELFVTGCAEDTKIQFILVKKPVSMDTTTSMSGHGALATQFARRYIDEGNIALLHNRIVELRSKGKSVFYSPWLSIVQSSGTGKTKSVFKLSETFKEPLFYVCHREKGDNGYPPATPDIFALLHNEPIYRRKHVTVDSDLYLYCRYVCFFFHVWRYCAHGKNNHNMVDGTWIHDVLPTACVEPVAENVAALNVSGEPYDASQRTIRDEILSDCDSLYSSVIHGHAADPMAVKYLGSATWERTAEGWINSRLKELYPWRAVSFIVAVDECSFFRAFPEDTRLQTDPLFQLGWAARLLWKVGGVLVTMDTFSEIISLMPEKIFPSARTLSVKTKLMICTDMMTNDLTYTAAKTVRSALTHRHILNTGRPLWSSQLLTATDPRDVYAFLLKKLLYCSLADVRSKMESPHAAAIICARTGLDPHPYSRLSRALVSSHLAHLDFFDHEKGCAVISYPADTALAHSTRLIWQEGHLLAGAVAQIYQLMRTREIEHGERGEIAAQIVLLRVADQLVQRQGIYTVRDFLQELLFSGGGLPLEEDSTVFEIRRIDSLRTLLSRCKCDGDGQKLLLEGVMNLAQFVKIQYRPTLGDLSEFFSRGLGVIARNNEKSFDLYLPVLLSRSIPPSDIAAAQPTPWSEESAGAAKEMAPLRGNADRKLGGAPIVDVKPRSGQKGAPESQEADKSPMPIFAEEMIGEEAFKAHLNHLRDRERTMAEEQRRQWEQEAKAAAEQKQKQKQQSFSRFFRSFKSSSLPPPPPHATVARPDLGDGFAALADLPIDPSRMTVLALSVKNYSNASLCNDVCVGDHTSIGGMSKETPYGIIGFYCTKRNLPAVYDLHWVPGVQESAPVTSGKKGWGKAGTPSTKYCLGVSVNNAHKMLSEPLQSAMDELISKVVDPLVGAAAATGEDLDAKKFQLVPRYGTVRKQDH